MKTKRIVSILLVAFMIFMLASCGNKKPSQRSDSGTSTTSGSNAPVETDADGEPITTEAGEETSAPTDSDGNTVTNVPTASKGGNNNSGGNNATNPVNFDRSKINFKGEKIYILREWDAYPRGQATVWDNWNDRVAEVEKKFNVDIVEKRWTVSLAQEMMSGVKPAGHLYQISSGEIYSYATSGYLADFNSAMSTSGINMSAAHFNHVNVQVNNINSKQYAAGFGNARVVSTVLFNNKIVKSLGYDIYKLVKDKQWTWDKMSEIAKKATVRNAQNVVTQYGLGYDSNIASALTLSNGGSLASFDGSGKPVVSLTSQPVRDALQKIYDWSVTDKVATYNWSNLAWDALDNEFAAGKIAMYFGGHNAISKAYSSLKDDYGIAPIPMGPRSKSYVSFLTDEYSYVIPKAYASRSTELLVLLDELYLHNSKQTSDSVFRDEWIRYFKTKEAFDAFKAQHTTYTAKWDPAVKLQIGTDKDPFSATLGKIFEGTITPGKFVDTYQSAYANDISDRYKSLKYTGKLK